MAKHDDTQQDNLVEEQAEQDVSEGTQSDLSEKFADIENRYKRVLADYQNLEKRVQEERINWIKASNKELLLRMLPVLDTLMLASLHSDDQSLTVSVTLFLDALKGEGVEKIETLGKQFDPHLMEAIKTEEGKEGKVLAELRAGYMLHDKLLRPAQVVVGTGK